MKSSKRVTRLAQGDASPELMTFDACKDGQTTASAWSGKPILSAGRPHLREYGNLMAPRDLAHAKRCSFAVVQKGSRNKTKGISMGFFLGSTTCTTALQAVQDTPLGCSISIAFRGNNPPSTEAFFRLSFLQPLFPVSHAQTFWSLQLQRLCQGVT